MRFVWLTVLGGLAVVMALFSYSHGERTCSAV